MMFKVGDWVQTNSRFKRQLFHWFFGKVVEVSEYHVNVEIYMYTKEMELRSTGYIDQIMSVWLETYEGDGELEPEIKEMEHVPFNTVPTTFGIGKWVQTT